MLVKGKVISKEITTNYNFQKAKVRQISRMFFLFVLNE